MILAVFLRVVGAYYYGAPSDPDISFNQRQAIGAFLSFLFFAVCIVAWGDLLRRALGFKENRKMLAVALGTFAAAWVAMALAHVGLIGNRYQSLMSLLLLTGPMIGAYLQIRNKRCGAGLLINDENSLLSALREGHIVLFSVIATVLTALMAAGMAVGASDVLRYHLVGPRLWSDAGHFYLPANVPLVMQCSYWEYLNLWGLALFGGGRGWALVEGQLFGQWTHALLGYGGTALALTALLRPLSVTTAWALAATLAALCVPSLVPAAAQAKNDWGASLWVFSGVALLASRQCQTQIQLICAGVLIGTGVGAKFTAAFAAIPLLLIATRTGGLSKAALGVVIGLAPLCLRNWIETGNPVFPSMNGFFQSEWIGPTWTQHQSIYEISGIELDPRAWLDKLWMIFQEAPLAVAAPGLLFVKTQRKELIWLWGAALSALVLFCAKVDFGFGDFARLFGPGLMMLNALGVLTLGLLVYSIASKALAGLSLAALLTLGLFSVTQSHLPLKIWSELGDYPSPVLVIRGLHIGGFVKGWLRTQAKPGELVLSTGDNQIYYLSALNVAVIPEQPELDRRTSGKRNPHDVLRTLRSFNGKLLVDSRHWSSFYWSRVAEVIGRLTFIHPEAIVVSTRSSDVYDLERLEREVYQSCMKPQLDPLAEIYLGFRQGATQAKRHWF